MLERLANILPAGSRRSTRTPRPLAGRPARAMAHRGKAGAAGLAGCVLAASLLASGALATARRAEADASPVVWVENIGVPVFTPARVADGRIYLTSAQATGPNVFALNAATGKVLWRFATSGAISVPPSVSATQVFVASDIGDTHFMRALDAQTRTSCGSTPAISRRNACAAIRPSSTQGCCWSRPTVTASTRSRRWGRCRPGAFGSFRATARS